MSDKPKVFKSTSYSTSIKGPVLAVDAWTGECVLSFDGLSIGLYADVSHLTEIRDIFQAALDDMEKNDG